MYKQLREIFFVLTVSLTLSSTLMAQKVALKTNLLYGATATLNLQLEFGISKKSSFELGAGLNWFDIKDNQKVKNLLV